MQQIYLDANATTPVLPEARRAAQAAMAEGFGNPSSTHSTGLKARAIMDAARQSARQALGVQDGRLLFTSGATEGIQTAILSVLRDVLERRKAHDEARPDVLLYGATEHKAVPEALAHWNAVLGLNLEILAIPVGQDGRHDLAWLRARVRRAALVCTMAANNETGVISDLDGIAQALAGSAARWLVDGVQALGKMSLDLRRRPIDYAVFSGHKLYAPKGIGLLYVREGSPFTPLIVGGGQEEGSRSGTENTMGIAAFGAVLDALKAGRHFQDATTLGVFRDRLAAALTEAFPGLVFNTPLEHSLCTTLNFSVPGVSSGMLLDLFDAAGIRVSGGSACSSAKAGPSGVLTAMGLAEWRTTSAVRLSFGPVVDVSFIDEACSRLRACGESLRKHGLLTIGGVPQEAPAELTRFVVDGACCYLLADVTGQRCIIIDPLPQLTARLVSWLIAHRYELVAVLDTHSHGDHVSSGQALRNSVGMAPSICDAVDALGWPGTAEVLQLGQLQVSRLAIPGHTEDSTAYLVRRRECLRYAFVGDTVLPGALGRSDFEQSAPLKFSASLQTLAHTVGMRTLLLPGHDYEQRFATTLQTEVAVQPLLKAALEGTSDAAEFAIAKAELEDGLGPTIYQTVSCGMRVDSTRVAPVEVAAAALWQLAGHGADPLLIDVRELYEKDVGTRPEFGRYVQHLAAPLSELIDSLPALLSLDSMRHIVFYCRSGNRSAQAARALRRLGRDRVWSLAGGLALLGPEAFRPVAEAA